MPKVPSANDYSRRFTPAKAQCKRTLSPAKSCLNLVQHKEEKNFLERTTGSANYSVMNQYLPAVERIKLGTFQCSYSLLHVVLSHNSMLPAIKSVSNQYLRDVERVKPKSLQWSSVIHPLLHCYLAIIPSVISIKSVLTSRRKDKASDFAVIFSGYPSLVVGGPEVDRDAVDRHNQLAEDHVHQEVVQRDSDLNRKKEGIFSRAFNVH